MKIVGNQIRPTGPPAGQVRFTMTIGLLYRRHFRALLSRASLGFVEYKGALDSLFTITGTHLQIQALLDWTRKVEEDALQAEWDRKVAGRSKLRPNAWCRSCGAKTSIFAATVKFEGVNYPMHRSCQKRQVG